jgi:hypothetical protein
MNGARGAQHRACEPLIRPLSACEQGAKAPGRPDRAHNAGMLRRRRQDPNDARANDLARASFSPEPAAPAPRIHEPILRATRPKQPAQLRASRPKPPADRVPAVAALLADQHRSRPYVGASYGERIVPRAQPEPARPLDRGFELPPPPWAGKPQVGPPPEQPAPPETLGAQALAELKARDGYEPPAPLFLAGPPITIEPLLPVRLPEPDWRAEERERAAEERTEALEEEPSPYPPPLRRPA